MPEARSEQGERITADRWLRLGRAALGVGLALALAVALAAALLFQGKPAPEAVGRIGQRVPDFMLTDQDGRPFNSRSLRGTVWVASFLFTRCSESCPLLSAKLLLVQDAVKEVPGLAEKVRLVSFSVDPERDRPSDLSTYLRERGADETVWRFLTGEKGQVAALSQEGFALAVGQPAGEPGGTGAGSIVHSDRFVLVDGEGLIRGYYSSLGESGDLDRLVADLKRLVDLGARR